MRGCLRAEKGSQRNDTGYLLMGIKGTGGVLEVEGE